MRYLYKPNGFCFCFGCLLGGVSFIHFAPLLNCVFVYLFTFIINFSHFIREFAFWQWWFFEHTLCLFVCLFRLCFDYLHNHHPQIQFHDVKCRLRTSNACYEFWLFQVIHLDWTKARWVFVHKWTTWMHNSSGLNWTKRNETKGNQKKTSIASTYKLWLAM